ncbi:hypothetical protein D6779_11715 [Candidatus Parcubacteria bacterium]|nr:MAG: hypothetical protein D6779_11715 [Candidatus Parcubacteria bacterium]
MEERQHPVLNFLETVVDFFIYMANDLPQEIAKTDPGFGLFLEILLGVIFLIPGLVLKLFFSLLKYMMDRE